VGAMKLRLIKTLVHLVVWVGEIFSLNWFFKELKMTYWRTNNFVASSLYFSFANQYSLGRGFHFPIVLVSRYKLSSCHTPIKPNLLSFPGIDVFAYRLLDLHEVCIIEQLNLISKQRLTTIYHHQLYPSKLDKAYNKKVKPRVF
jgi:hypothetical protein